MAVTVISRPQGHKFGDTSHVAVVTEVYAGLDASFVQTGHGLIDGDYIYAISDIEDYGGFWYVDQATADNFRLKYSEGGDYLQFVAAGSITYYVATGSVDWSCVHLPIVYELGSDLYPTNSVDTVRAISSFTDANGYVNLNLSGALKGTVNDLHFVKISGSSDSSLNGVYQITNAVSTSDVTIDLSYDAGLSLVGASIQFYYNNYHIRVKVFGGLPSDHEWAALKPYVELSELQFVPYSNGEVKFSIHEILKSQINTRNNLLLATLPCNLDFFTGFYISYAESYDESDGTEVTTYTSSFVSDEFGDDYVSAGMDALNLWLESGAGSEWTDTSTPQVHLVDTQSSEFKYTSFPFVVGNQYKITYDISFNLTTAPALIASTTLSIRIMDSTGVTTYDSKSVSSLSPTGTFVFTAVSGMDRIRIQAIQTVSSGSQEMDVIVDSFTLEVFQESGFSGYTANSMLEFKNVYSGFLTDHIYEWLTLFEEITIFDDQYLDLSFIVPEESFVDIYLNGDLFYSFQTASPGVYRLPITQPGAYQIQSGEITSEEINVVSNTQCYNQSINLSWLNNLGGFDYWKFTAEKDNLIEIQESIISKQNIFPSWPKSYGATADTIRKQTKRISNKAFIIRSQHLTEQQVEAISYIKSSVLVQIVNSRQDRRTVIVDSDSFMKYADGDKTYTIAFKITFTDDIPAQSV